MEISLQEIEAILQENIRVLKVVVKEKRVRTLLKDRLKADPAFAAEYRSNINAKAKARRDAKKKEMADLKAALEAKVNG